VINRTLFGETKRVEVPGDLEMDNQLRDSVLWQTFLHRRIRIRTQARAGTPTPAGIGAPMTELIFDHDRLDVY